jgi:hemolysin III
VVWLEASSQKSHEPDYSNCRRFMRTVETPRAGSLAGMALKLCLPDRFDRLAILLYLLLGWSGVMAYEAVLGALPGSTLTLLAAGGFLFTVGVIFHVWEGLCFQNAIWHTFVLVAAACNYGVVLDCVVLARA